MVIDEQFDHKTVQVALGEVVELRLAENPTTGFHWRMTQDGRPVCDVKDTAYNAAGTRPGAGGAHSWRLTAAQPGRSQVELVYQRAWDAAAAAGRRFSVTIDVAGREPR
jgi:inhibitor of cysteine peptidase